MFGALEQSLLTLVQIVPLHMFVFLGSFIEEVIAPIPSPAVMIAAGTAASLQHYTPLETSLLSISGALGKAAGAGVIYIIAYKLEDAIVGRLGSFFGINKTKLDAFGEKLTGTWRDYFTLVAIRMAPFVPSAVVSIGSAVLKVPFTMFIITTFIGTIVRDGIYLYVGYTGTKVFGDFISASNNLEGYLTAAAGLIVAALVAYFIVRKIRNKTGMG
jgi:membrane protein DedA with SNARE-associated domain